MVAACPLCQVHALHLASARQEAQQAVQLAAGFCEYFVMVQPELWCTAPLPHCDAGTAPEDHTSRSRQLTIELVEVRY